VPRPAMRLLLLATPLLLAALLERAPAAQVLPLPTVDSPQGGGRAVVLEPVPIRAAVTRRTIFTCITPQLVTYSDRPCGPLTDTRQLRTVTPAGEEVRASPSRPQPPPGTTRQRDDSAGSSEPDRAREPACARLEQDVAELDQRMRAGYAAREAGRLWQRWREARARLRDADC
jgi:hypothetical protein